ncbi:hypothetical protein XBJ2_2000001 [Xenorhabdus bovienii str. Jollieti]|uniref:DUF1883 domain-containing protein n=2 Tax=Xenorhabdus bovienii TaxID=40576 RepID=D3V604_XENBS|nr:DUF1883 domain-containing protein [Xenorhabdus bovienii]CBJ83083.1 hypothetical protein XBJ1_3965 [Xenorhabdus bovienii SS-2004]CDH28813.1 hypothetical protein XBJ2_2000001 [Xenorhabdus bovienii str. Jollieti]
MTSYLKEGEMSYIHSREYLKDGNVVSVQCSHQINVLVMDDNQYSNYRNGRQYRYYGGFYKQFPANIIPPHSGYWNVVLAMPPGYSANIKHTISVLNA